MTHFARVAAGTIVAAALLAGCTNDDPAPTTSAPVVTSPSTTPAPTPSQTATSEVPSPSASPTATAAGVPADWREISASQAGIVVDDVDEVIGAWRLPGGGVASVTAYKNDVDSTSPDAVFKAYFGDSPGFTKETRTSDSGAPVLVARFSPEEGDGGDAQVYFFVLTPGEITSAFMSGTPNEIESDAEDLWEFVRADS